MIDAQAEAATRRGIERRGVTVTFQRVSGIAPRSFTFSAEVTASITTVAADSEAVARTGYSAREPGAITQDERKVIVMAGDLKAKRFPLPLRKKDKMIVKDSGDVFTVTRGDSLTRAMAGAIELVVTGVA